MSSLQDTRFRLDRAAHIATDIIKCMIVTEMLPPTYQRSWRMTRAGRRQGICLLLAKQPALYDRPGLDFVSSPMALWQRTFRIIFAMMPLRGWEDCKQGFCELEGRLSRVAQWP